MTIFFTFTSIFLDVLNHSQHEQRLRLAAIVVVLILITVLLFDLVCEVCFIRNKVIKYSPFQYPAPVAALYARNGTVYSEGGSIAALCYRVIPVPIYENCYSVLEWLGFWYKRKTLFSYVVLHS